MDLRRLRHERSQLALLRTIVQERQIALNATVTTLLASSDYGVRRMARTLGFSPAYISNLRAGRVAASENLLDRLERLQ